jgi:hypothetical protein
MCELIFCINCTELSNQQSREIQQHHSRSNSARQSLHAVISRTTAGLSFAAGTVKQACYRPVPRQDNTLDDFGISSGNDDPLLAPQEEQQDFVLLRPFKLLPRRDGWGAVANLDLFFTVCANVICLHAQQY